MSGAVYQLLAEDAALKDLGVESVYVDYSMDQAPREDRYLILRWGQEQYVSAVKTGPRNLDVWAHQPLEWGTDFTDLNSILRRVRDILENAPEIVGIDEVTFVQADYQGSSGNMTDPGFSSLTRYSSYRVLLKDMV